MQLRRIDHHSVVPIILDELGVQKADVPEVQKVAIIAESLRVALTGSCIFEDDPGWIEPVSIRRLLFTVSDHLGPVWPEIRLRRAWSPTEAKSSVAVPTKTIGKVLRYLELLGDAVSLGHGRWIPAPLRKIVLPDSGVAVVAGGLATRKVRDAGLKVFTWGVGRLLEFAEGDSIPEQPFSHWAGWFPRDLEAFTHEQIEAAKKHASPSSPTFMEYDVFISSKMRFVVGTSWIQASQLPSTGFEQFMLCRTHPPRRYFVGEFRSGQLLREYPIGEVEVARWLQVGLCNLHGLGNVAVWEGDWLRIYGMLPIALRRQLVALGCPSDLEKSTYWVPSRFRPLVSEILSKYGFQVRSRQGVLGR